VKVSKDLKEFIELLNKNKNKYSNGRTKDLQDIEWIKMYGKDN
jgi:hypothetical protein